MAAQSSVLPLASASVLRQTGHLQLDVELPALLTVAGLLLLIARRPSISMPSWLREDSHSSSRDTGE
jgi:hypothetical protein